MVSAYKDQFSSFFSVWRLNLLFQKPDANKDRLLLTVQNETDHIPLVTLQVDKFLSKECQHDLTPLQRMQKGLSKVKSCWDHLVESEQNEETLFEIIET